MEKCRESAARECCGAYKLVIMDLHLEDMSGYEAAKQAREILGRDTTKIIGMTALLEQYITDKL